MKSVIECARKVVTEKKSLLQVENEWYVWWEEITGMTSGWIRFSALPMPSAINLRKTYLQKKKGEYYHFLYFYKHCMLHQPSSAKPKLEICDQHKIHARKKLNENFKSGTWKNRFRYSLNGRTKLWVYCDIISMPKSK